MSNLMHYVFFYNKIILVNKMSYDFMINKLIEKLDNVEIDLLYKIVTDLDKTE